jgi:uncharacterized protein (TIGR03545 family)
MKKEETNPVKPVSIPSVFRKPVKKKTFERKYVKYIEHPHDRKFFISCFDEKDNNCYIRSSITKDEVKKIKDLLKIIKTNRKGAIQFIPLVFACAVTALIFIFFTVFANPLLENALETGLEAVFEAKSDVNNLRINPFRFQISIGGITIANRDKPMTNLFQMGRTEIRLKPEAVLRGKIYIEEIRADTIRFGTARTVSGTLPGKPPRQKPVREKTEAPPLIDLRNFDAMALLNREYEKLNTPRMYDEAINAYNASVVMWQGQVESANARVNELRTVSQPLINLNAANIRDIEAVVNTVQDINNALQTLQAAANDVTAIISGIENDINTARQLETNARNAIAGDINHFRSYIDLGSGAAFAAVEPFLRDVLSDAAEQYIEYGVIALEVLERIKEISQEIPRNEKPQRQQNIVFRGRDVHYPAAAYPAFYLGVLASDFTIDAWNWSFDLRNISSSPDITGRPVTLNLGLGEEGGSLNRRFAFNGSADFRTNPQERFSADVSGSGIPVSLGDQLSMVGINGFSGNSAFSLNLSGQTNGSFSVGSDVKISQARVIEPKGTLAEAIDTAIREVDNINLGIQYSHHVNQRDEFTITTNIAELIVHALRRTAEVYARRALEEIERLLRQKIEEHIYGRLESREEIDALLRMARGDRTVLDQTRNALNAKREEFESRLRATANEAVQQVRDEAARQTEQAIQGLLPGLLPRR